MKKGRYNCIYLYTNFFTEVKIVLRMKAAKKSSATKISIRIPQLLKCILLSYKNNFLPKSQLDLVSTLKGI